MVWYGTGAFLNPVFEIRGTKTLKRTLILSTDRFFVKPEEKVG